MSFEDAQTFLGFYFYISLLCSLLDFIVVCYTMNEFGVKGEEDAEMILLGLCCPFVAVNLFWLSFLLQLKFDLPAYISTFIMDALRGAGKNISAHTNKAIVKGAK